MRHEHTLWNPQGDIFVIRAILLAGLLIPAVAGATQLEVFTTVLPLQSLAEKIGGEHVNVTSMVQPGDDPHTFSPTSQQIAKLAQANLYITAGIQFEKVWMDRIESTNPEMEIIGDSDEDDHGHDHKHEHELDPHPWTSPLLAMKMADTIYNALIKLDPANSNQYDENRRSLQAELSLLDQEIQEQMQNLKQRKFMVFHPAWGHFAEQYGLIQIPIEHEGKEPGARALVELIREAKKENIKVIFVQPQFSRRAAEQVADAIDGRVVPIDPLSADYINNMKKISQQLSETLQ